MNSSTASDYSNLSVVLTTMTGLRLEISALISQINIYQDMFSPCMTGNVSVLDGAGIFDKMPIAGYETIEFAFDTIDNGNPVSFNHTFRVFSVDDYTAVKQNLKSYTIKFITQAAYDNRVQVCYNMRKLKTHEAIEPLLTNYLKLTPDQYEMKDLNGELQRPMIFGYLNPFAIIRKITNKSLGMGTNATYLFYQRKDKYVLNSIENIITSSVAPTRTYNYVPSTADIENRFSKDRIYAYHIESAFNRLEHELSGARVIESVVHDMARKSQKKFTYDYGAKFSEIKHLEENPFISNVEDSVDSYRTYQSATSATLNNLVSQADFPYNVESRRTNQLQNLKTLKVVAEVPGDLTNDIGDIVELNIISATNNTPVVEKHKYLSGKYIITAIHHAIDRDKYIQILELTKDSLPDTLDIIQTGNEFTG